MCNIADVTPEFCANNGPANSLAIDALADFVCVSKLTSLCTGLNGHTTWLQRGLAFYTRLLRNGSTLRELTIQEYNLHNLDGATHLFTGDAMPAFVAALRASSLTKLHLCGYQLLDTVNSDGALDDALAVIYACAEHTTLRDVSFYAQEVVADTEHVIGEALGALIATAASVEVLDLTAMRLTAVGLAKVFGGVAATHRLRVLILDEQEFDSHTVRDIIFPAVTANSSLRELRLGGMTPGSTVGAIEALVRGRSAQGRAENERWYELQGWHDARQLAAQAEAELHSSDDDVPAA